MPKFVNRLGPAITGLRHRSEGPMLQAFLESTYRAAAHHRDALAARILPSVANAIASSRSRRVPTTEPRTVMRTSKIGSEVAQLKWLWIVTRVRQGREDRRLAAACPDRATQPRHAHHCAQLPGLCLLLTRDGECMFEIGFSFGRISFGGRQSDFASGSVNLGLAQPSLVDSTVVIASSMQRQASSNRSSFA